MKSSKRRLEKRTSDALRALSGVACAVVLGVCLVVPLAVDPLAGDDSMANGSSGYADVTDAMSDGTAAAADAADAAAADAADAADTAAASASAPDDADALATTAVDDIELDWSQLDDVDDPAAAYVENAFAEAVAQAAADAGTAADADAAAADESDASGTLSSPAASANYGETYFTDETQQAIYQALKAFVEDVAANGGSTIFTYSFDAPGYYSIGSTSLDDTFDSLDVPAIFEVVLADCPYDFYWCDKTTTGMAYSYGTRPDGTAYLVTIYLYFTPAEEYAGSEDYTIDADLASATSTAVANAKAIVDEYSDECDVVAVLTTYKDEICSLVSYNSDVASDDDVSYGNPWQLVWVFDGDDDTNVVCEGYSKAFQYLCDLTWPDNDPVWCYTVTGTLTGGTGSGGHMWNIVSVDGESYLVDVTNSDSGTVGKSGGLFLADAGSATSSSASGYAFKISSTTVTYAYDSDTLALYSEEILTLSDAELTSYYTHSYEAAVTEPTCTEGGSTTYTCSVCGSTYTADETDALGHDYQATETVAATCTEDGSVTYVCANDASHTYTETLAATGHTAADAVVEDEVAATCTEEGSYDEVVYCTVCGEELSRQTVAVAATGHSYEAVVTDPTCTEGGYTTYTCTVCGDAYTADETEATGHDYAVSWLWAEDGSSATATAVCANDTSHVATATASVLDAGGNAIESETVAATCTEAGCTTYTASVSIDGEAYTDVYMVEIAALGHDYEATETVAATCTEDGSVTYVCANDASHTYTEVLAALGHDWGEGVVTKAADCTSEGEVTYTCSRDASHTYIEATAALGHTEGEAVVENEAAATCEDEGSYDEVVYCTVCGEELSRQTVATDALGHDYEATETVEPSCTQAGYILYVCANDASHTYTEALAALGHDYVAAVTDPTCTESGYTTFTCSRCDDVYTSDETDALGHDYVATEADDGSTVYTCSRCGDSYTVSPEAESDAENATKTVTRIAGANRYETAALEATQAYDSCTTVVLATGAGYADALTATSLAGALDAPILLVDPKGAKDDVTYEAIESLGASEVVIVGGTSAVSEDVRDALEADGLSVVRVSGANRYETAEAIYAYGERLGAWGDVVLVASGKNAKDTAYADALSVSAAAYAECWPILLADASGELSDASAAYVGQAAAAGAEVVVLGGTSAVADLDVAFERVGGDNRYETSVLIAEFAVERGVLSWDGAAFATGTNYPDALAGSALQGARGSVLLLVAEGKTAYAVELLAEVADQIDSASVLGGESAVSASVVDTLLGALGWGSYDYEELTEL